MNQEARKAHDKPVLSAEGFQRLLSAAYVLQVDKDRRSSVGPIGAGPTSSFAAGAIIQKRTPSVMIREPQLQAGQPVAVPGNEITKQHPYPAGLVRHVGPTVPLRVKVLLRRPMSWRTIEPLAIAIVFCMMMGLSIHRLSAVPGRTSRASKMLKKQNDFQPARLAEKVLASSQPVMARNSRQSPSGGDADIVAEDIVIRHQNRAVDLLGRPGFRLTFGRDAGMPAADTVVQYGADVKMWSGNPKRAGLDRPGH